MATFPLLAFPFRFVFSILYYVELRYHTLYASVHSNFRQFEHLEFSAAHDHQPVKGIILNRAFSSINIQPS